MADETLILVTRIQGDDEWTQSWNLEPRYLAVLVARDCEARLLAEEDLDATRWEEEILASRLAILHGAYYRKLVPFLDRVAWKSLADRVAIFLHLGGGTDLRASGWREAEQTSKSRRGYRNYQDFLDLAEDYTVFGVNGLRDHLPALSRDLQRGTLSPQNLTELRDFLARQRTRSRRSEELLGPDWSLVYHRLLEPFASLRIGSEALPAELAAGGSEEEIKVHLSFVCQPDYAKELVACLWLSLLGYTFEKREGTWKRVHREMQRKCGLPPRQSVREIVEAANDPDFDKQWRRLLAHCGLWPDDGGYRPDEESFLWRFATTYDDALRNLVATGRIDEKDLAALAQVPFGAYRAWYQELADALIDLKHQWDEARTVTA